MHPLIPLLAIGPLHDQPTPAPQDIQVTPRLISADSPREVASAQVPIGFWQPLDGSDSQSTQRFTWHGEEVELRLDKNVAEPAMHLSRMDNDAPPLMVELDANGFGNTDLRSLGVQANLMFFQREAGLKSTLRTLYHFQAEARIGSHEYNMVWFDMDIDGRASFGDRWVVLEAEHFRAATLPNLMFAGNNGDEPWYLEGQGLRMGKWAEEGKLHLKWGPESRTRSEFLAQRAERINAKYAEWFDPERSAFLATYEIDPERPRTERSLGWYHTYDLEDAKDYAQRTGRPLYVEFTSDGCSWCKRLEWLNYSDKEVADLLRGYARVKLYKDLDPAESFQNLGLKGVPSVVLFGPDGTPSHTVNGWSPPAEQAAELRKIQAAQ